MQAEMGAIGHRKGGKIEPKGDQNAPKIEPKGCQKPPRYLLDDILRKTGNSDVEMVEIRAPGWHRKRTEKFNTRTISAPRGPQGAFKSVFLAGRKSDRKNVAKLVAKLGQQYPQNGVST